MKKLSSTISFKSMSCDVGYTHTRKYADSTQAASRFYK